MRRLIKILAISIVVVLALFALLFAMIAIPKVQRWLVDEVTTTINERCGAKVQINAVYLKPFSQLSLRDVRVDDAHGDTMIYVKEAAAHFSLWELVMSHSLVIDGVALDEAYFRLAWDETGRMNLSDLIDAFRKKKKKKKEGSRLVLRMEELRLDHSRYVMYKAGHQERGNPILFEHWDMDVHDIDALFRLSDYHKGLLDVTIERLSAKEKSGIVIRDFTAHLQATGKDALITSVRLKTECSDVVFDSITADYSRCWDTIVVADGNAKRSFNVKRVPCSFILRPSRAFLSDVQHWVPQFARRGDYFDLACRFSGTLDDMHVRDFDATWNGGFDLHADIDLRGLPQWRSSVLDLRFRSDETRSARLQDLVAQTLGRPFQMPSYVVNLGDMACEGRVTGRLSELTANALIRTEAGDVTVDGGMYVGTEKGFSWHSELASGRLLLGKVLGVKNVGEVEDVKLAVKVEKEIMTGEGTVRKVQYKGYDYHDLSLAANLKGNDLKGQVELNDSNAVAQMEMAWKRSTDGWKLNGGMNVARFRPYALHMLSSQPDLNIRGKMNVESEKNVAGGWLNVDADYIAFSGQGKNLRLRDVRMNMASEGDSTNVEFDSPIVKARLTGDYTLSELGKGVERYMKIFLPTLFADDNNDVARKKKSLGRQTHKPQHARLEIYDLRPNELLDVFDINMTVGVGTHVSAELDEAVGNASLQVAIPQMTMGKRVFRNTSLEGRNDVSDMLTVSLKTDMDSAEAAVMVNAFHDQMVVSVNWNNPEVTFGSLSAHTTFSGEPRGAVIELNPSTFMIGDDLWRVHRSRATTDFEKVTIGQFTVDHERQYMRASGVLSKSMSDSLQVSLRDVRLGYVMQLVGLSALDLDGSVTGNAIVYGALGDRTLNINADAKGFKVNDALLGDVTLRSEWDNSSRGLLVNGQCQMDGMEDEGVEGGNILRFGGRYVPDRDTLAFRTDAKRLPVRFLRRYLDGLLDNLNGYANGQLDIFGSPKHIKMNGDIVLEDGSFEVGMLGARYEVNDTLYIRPDAFVLDNFEATDEQGNKALVKGVIRHQSFKDIGYDIVVVPEKVCVLSLSPSKDRLFYGKAFASGRASISGSPGVCRIVVNAKTEPGTNVTLSLVSSASSVTTPTSFITYVNRSDTLDRDMVYEKEEVATVNYETSSGTHVTVLLNIDANTDASIHLLTSETGDELTATGRGTVTLRYDSKESQAMLGGLYEVESGRYTFTLEQIIQREFTLREGGTIQFAGAPTAARVNVSAQYFLPSVSLLDILDDADLEGVARTNVPVNCLLHISGVLEHPVLKFDIELPSDEELQRKVLNIVSSEEVMNREMLSLLVLGTFYRPDYVASSNSTSTSSSISNSMASMATSTVSGQLNQLLSQYTDKLSLGLNAHLGDYEQGFNQGSEYEVALHYTPNNRLIINSNLGYRNDYLYTNTAADNTSTGSFIGDLDIEYKLTRSGKLRAKAYTHSADRYYYNVSGGAKTTQGVGIIYREDFNTWRGLFRRGFMSQAKRDSIQYVMKQRQMQSTSYQEDRLEQMIRERKTADSLEARFDSLVAPQ